MNWTCPDCGSEHACDPRAVILRALRDAKETVAHPLSCGFNRAGGGTGKHEDCDCIHSRLTYAIDLAKAVL